MTTLEDKALNLLRDLVSIPSWAGEAEGITFVSEWCQRHRIDFKIREVDGQPFNLVAQVGDDVENGLLFNSHIDTVPPGDALAWSRDPFSPLREGDYLYGLGACDAKGSLAAMMGAFSVLVDEWRPGYPAYTLMVMGGEERGNRGTRLEVEVGLRGRAAVVGEPTSLQPLAAVKGGLRLEVVVAGRAAHASQPEAGKNAIYPMAEVLLELERLGQTIRKRHETMTGHPSLVVTTIEGGRAFNVIPDRCTISIDRRLIPGETLDGALDEIEEALGRVQTRRPDLSISKIHQIRATDAVRVDTDEPIVRLAKDAAEKNLGRSMAVGGFTACCDANILGNDGRIPTVIWGPGDLGMAHQVDEYVDVREVAMAARAYLDLGRAWKG